MINPTDVKIDIEEQQDWLMDHKAVNGLSWSNLEKPMVSS